jgi:glycerophosphoryl diester phosphodiesterase
MHARSREHACARSRAGDDVAAIARLRPWARSERKHPQRHCRQPVYVLQCARTTALCAMGSHRGAAVATSAVHHHPRSSRRLSVLRRHFAAGLPSPAVAVGGNDDAFVLIAHRGGQEIFPENTLAAFLSAVERLAPEPCIEFDVQLTADGVPVVIHDDTVDRTVAQGLTAMDALGSSAVAEMTLADLQRLQLSAEGNSWGMGSGNGATGQVPTLEQLLRAVAGRCHLLLELKSKQSGLVWSTVATLKECGWLDVQSVPYKKGGVTVFCQDLDQLDDVGRLAPHATRMLAVSQIDAQTIELAQAHQLQGVSTAAAHENLAQQVALAKAAGLRCRTSAIGAPDDTGLANLQRAVEAGADGTTIDWPFKARAVIRQIRARDETRRAWNVNDE